MRRAWIAAACVTACGCAWIAALDDHTATVGPDASTGGDGGVAGDASTDGPVDGPVAIKVSPSTLSVLPGDLVSVTVTLTSRPAGSAVALSVIGTDVAAGASDGGTVGTNLGTIAADQASTTVLLKVDRSATGTVTSAIAATAAGAPGSANAAITLKLGSLDSTFAAGSGMATTDLGTNSEPSDDVIAGVVRQDDGRVQAFGTKVDTTNGGRAHLMIARYTSAGVLDTPDGGPGYFQDTSNATATDETCAAAIQVPGGKIAVATKATFSGVTQRMVYRYLPSLDVDTSFGAGTGHVRVLTSTNDGPTALANPFATAKILVAGYVADGTPALTLVNASGTIDTSFGDAGTATFPFAKSTSASTVTNQLGQAWTAIAPLTANSTTNGDLVVTSTNEAGAPEPTFADASTLRAVLADKPEVARAVAWTPLGALVVGSAKTAAGGLDVVVARVKPTGALDTSFGASGTGWVTTDILHQDEVGTAVAVDATNGDILVAAAVGLGGALAIVRYDTNGTLKGIYGPFGFRRPITGSAILVQDDEKVLVGGAVPNLATPTTRDFAIVRVVP